jgi:invasion protein IalB
MRTLAVIAIGLVLYLAGAASVLGLQYAMRAPSEGITTAAYGDWRLNCPPRGQTNALCQLSQDLVRQGTNTPLVHFEVSRIGNTHRLAVVVPRGVLLEPGLGFAVGARPQQKLVYQTCDLVGCIAYVPLEGGVGDAMNRGGTGRITITDRNGAAVPLEYSLRGFADGVAVLDRDAFRRTSGIAMIGL